MEGNKQETQIMTSINPFDKYDIHIDSSPFQKIISDKLNIALNSPKESLETVKSSDEICGTISWDLSDNILEKISKITSVFDYAKNKLDGTIQSVIKDINSYFERKISEYCFKHNISLLDWSKNGVRKKYKNKVEYYYLDEFICSVEIIEDKLFQDDNKLTKSIILKYD